MMTHLWVRDENDKWRPLPLEGGAFDLVSRPPRSSDRLHDRDKDGMVLLVSSGAADAQKWSIVAGPGSRARVNGRQVVAGLWILHDRDEICVNGAAVFYFSTETLASVVPFPGAAEPLYCPRCKQEIEKENMAVRCPQCRVWYHQSEPLPCWTYDKTCALDDQPTSLGGTYRWTPAKLWEAP